jgi:hypothetical protein
MPRGKPAMAGSFPVFESSHLGRMTESASMPLIRPGKTNCGLRPDRSTLAQDLPFFSVRTGNEGWAGVQGTGPGLRTFSTCLPTPGCA